MSTAPSAGAGAGTNLVRVRGTVDAVELAAVLAVLGRAAPAADGTAADRDRWRVQRLAALGRTARRGLSRAPASRGR